MQSLMRKFLRRIMCKKTGRIWRCVFLIWLRAVCDQKGCIVVPNFIKKDINLWLICLVAYNELFMALF